MPLLPELMQVEPSYGAAPTHETEIRVAYGQRGLYVAFVCHDEPRHVRGAFARKDQIPASDKVSLFIDPNNDDTNGYQFVVNPSGAQHDAQISRDGHFERLWDGVWQAAARKHDHGWSAEMFIPWSTIRFDRREEYTFGLNVERHTNHVAEKLALSPPPQGLPGFLSWASDYEGVEGIEPGLNFELRPYVSGRFAIRRPAGSLDDSWAALPNAGYEAKYGVYGNLTLDMAVNPDFGQAEVDPAVLNLGPFEVFFNERRQMFLEAKTVFETDFRLFYTRRVGNNPRAGRADTTDRIVHGEEERGELVAADPQTRILEAVRLTGEPTPGWRVGAFTATTGPTYGVQEFSDGSREQVGIDPLTQWSVIRVRHQLASQRHMGGILTVVNRTEGDDDAYTGGVDYGFDFRRLWRHWAQVIGTHDGERAGMGGIAGVRRRTKNWNLRLRSKTLTPHANFNDAGFMQFADFVEGEAEVKAYNAQPVGKVRRMDISTQVKLRSTYDGMLTEKNLFNRANLTTLGLWRVHVFGGLSLPKLDPFETRGNIAYEVPLHWFVGGRLSTPWNRRISASINPTYGEQDGNPGPDLGVDINARPVDRLMLQLGGNVRTSFGRPRWVAESDDGEPVFGAADLISTEGTLRATLGILPTLTVQTYNQLLYSTAHHDDFFILEDPRTLVPTDPAPYQGEVDQSLTALTSNTIARWEYLPGSFLFLVYTHRTRLDGGGMRVKFSPELAFTNLTRAGAEDEDILFVKLVHLFGF